MDIFSIFFNITVCCMFSLESPHQGDSNKYAQHTIFNIIKKIILIILNLQRWDYFKRLMNESETAVVNKTSVREPLSSTVD